MNTATVNIKGQIVIPAELRKKFGLTSGKKVIFVEKGNEIIITASIKEYVDQFAGILNKDSKAIEILMEERKKDKLKGK